VGTVSANGILLIAAAINGNSTLTAPAGYSTLVDAANGGTNTKLVVFWLPEGQPEGQPQGTSSFSTNTAKQSAVPSSSASPARTPPRRPRSRR